jgi:DNA-binding XRE family transcriptional regulator/mannose-6-phosphate isomerase-like protein (cupin superfamily)
LITWVSFDTAGRDTPSAELQSCQSFAPALTSLRALAAVAPTLSAVNFSVNLSYTYSNHVKRCEARGMLYLERETVAEGSKQAGPGAKVKDGGAKGGRISLPSAIGERLRTSRQNANMSVRELGRNVGVSASLISQVEHGKATPSVGTLYSIVSTLGISLDELFFDEQRQPQPVDPGNFKAPSSTNAWKAPSDGPVLRARNRLSLTLATGVRWERLTASHDPRVEFLYATYPAGSESCPADRMMTHAGSEYGVVLQGKVGITVGEGSYELESGDSVAFESMTPHRIWAIGDEAAVTIWTVVGREGDPRVNQA